MICECEWEDEQTNKEEERKEGRKEDLEWRKESFKDNK